MRNLKRALSLGLTAAMISGLMVMGSSAAGYADVTSEQNQEAIEVLQTVGIMVGDENGNFNPDEEVTRNEMAVVMSNLMAYNVATYANTSPFTDVPSWAEPYVAACWTNGITAGYDATTYGGSDTVTTAQAALMLMKALGYFQYSSDFGSDWQLATITQGNKIDLFSDVDSGVREAMTRNDLAQLVLNTLESGTVEASSDITEVTTGDVSVTTGKVEYNYVTSQKDYAKAISDLEAVYATGISTSGYIVELGEKLYDGDLKKTENTTDDFGRPATEWKYGTETVGTFGNAPDATWTAKVTKKALYEAATKSVVDDLEDGTWTMEYYVDGVRTVVDENDIDSFMDKNNTEKINDNQDTGNGTVTELFVDDDADQVTVVVINTYVFQATEDYNESSDDVNVAVAGDTAITLDSYDLDGENFDVQNVLEDDYLLITATKTAGSRYEVQSVAVAGLVSGEVTAFSKESDVTIDGTTYSYSATTLKDGVKGEITSTGGQTSLVLDQYGYVIAVDDTIVGGNYLFVTDTERSLGNAVDAYAYTAEGASGIISLKKVAGSTSASVMEDALGWYTYSADDSSRYTLSTVRGSYDTVDNMDTTGNTYADQQILSNGSATLPVKLDGTTFRANEKTIFVIVDEDGDVYTYTGVSNAPDIDVNAGNTENIEVGYVYKTSDKYATYVFINVEDADANVDSSTENDTYIFLTELASTKDDGEDTYAVYKAIQDGSETDVEADSDDYDVMKLYTKVKTDSTTDRITDMYELAVDRKDGTWAKIDLDGDERVTYSNGVLTIGDNSFIVNSGSSLNMVLDYSSDAITTSDSDVKDMMSDKGADYEVYTNVGGNSLKNTLNGYAIDGYYYIVTEDDNSYSGGTGSNSTLDYLYLYVNGAEYVGTATDPEEPVDTEGTESYVDGGDVAVKFVDDTKVTVSKVKNEVTALLEDAGYTNIKTTGITATGGEATAENSKGNEVSFDVTVTKYWSVSVNDKVKQYVEDGKPADVDVDDTTGTGYVVNGTDYEDYGTYSDTVSAKTSIVTGYVEIPKTVSGGTDTTITPKDGFVKVGATVTVTTKLTADTKGKVVTLTDDEGDTVATVTEEAGTTSATLTFKADSEVTSLTIAVSDAKETFGITTKDPDAMNGLTVKLSAPAEAQEDSSVEVAVTVTGHAEKATKLTLGSGYSWVTASSMYGATISGQDLTIPKGTNYGTGEATFTFTFTMGSADVTGLTVTLADA